MGIADDSAGVHAPVIGVGGSMLAVADKRADLDLHVSLLAEHELTKLVEHVAALAERAGVRANADPEIEEVKKDVAPEAVLDEIETNQAPE